MRLTPPRVLLTRPAGRNVRTAAPLAAAGWDVVEVPLIETVALGVGLPEVLPSDWVVFTSRAAVAAVDVAGLGACSVAAVGPATARALAAAGRVPDVVPTEARAKGVVAELSRRAGVGRVVYPCARVTQGELEAGLAALGIPLVRVPVYETVCPAGAGAGLDAVLPVDVIALASGSAARSLCGLGRDIGAARVVVIGPSTRDVCVELGVAVAGVASPYTAEGLAEAVQALW